ncbi:MAG: subtype I-E CRISPR-associated protein Cse2 [Rhodobacteraceae bacterium HLUCCA12]|nr:MAG: subtype I-E CRISPR-associated protein Cse2 [Rhodobacteraceae bacterium HLUCCA12]
MPDNTVDVPGRARAIAAALAYAEPGERAAARRMGAEGAAVFWRIVARHGIAPKDEEKWRRITKLLALLTPASATESVHEAGRHFGAVLADGGDAQARLEKPALSEHRLARLLAARGQARLDALERAVRALARNRPKVDVESLAWAVLNNDARAIARTYYTRLDRRADIAEKENTNE